MSTCAHVGCAASAEVVAIVEGHRQVLCLDHVRVAIRRELSVETLWDEPVSPVPVPEAPRRARESSGEAEVTGRSSRRGVPSRAQPSEAVTATSGEGAEVAPAAPALSAPSPDDGPESTVGDAEASPELPSSGAQAATPDASPSTAAATVPADVVEGRALTPSRGPEHLAESGAPAAATAPRAEQAPAPSPSSTEPTMARPTPPPEPLLRPDADAHPELCRVDGCDLPPHARGVCQRDYNRLVGGYWTIKGADILAPSKVGRTVTPASRVTRAPVEQPLAQVAELVGAAPGGTEAEIVAAVAARVKADAAAIEQVQRRALAAEEQVADMRRERVSLVEDVGASVRHCKAVSTDLEAALGRARAAEEQIDGARTRAGKAEAELEHVRATLDLVRQIVTAPGSWEEVGLGIDPGDWLRVSALTDQVQAMRSRILAEARRAREASLTPRPLTAAEIERAHAAVARYRAAQAELRDLGVEVGS